MKHPQHILALDKVRFGIEGCTGFVGMSSKSFFQYAERSLIIARREELEKDERYAQLLPYLVLIKRSEAGSSIFTYQRGKGVGESRLAGASSVGVGGHVDLADVVFGEDSVIDVISTIAQASSRELREEIDFVHAENGESTNYNGLMATIQGTSAYDACLPKFRGVINDVDDPVGRVHYGAVFSIEVPDHFDCRCREEELHTMGFKRVDHIVGEELDSYENWSKIVIETFSWVMQ